MTAQRLEISLTERPPSASGLVLCFAHKQTCTIGGSYHGLASTPNPRVLRFDWPVTATPPDRPVTVLFRGRRPELVAAIWLPARAAKTSAMPGLSQQIETIVPSDRFGVRRNLIGTVGDDGLRRRMAAMCRFDEATDLEQLELRGEPDLAANASHVANLLLARAERRGAFALRNLPFEPNIGDELRNRTRIEAVEALCHSALHASFPAPRGRLDFRLMRATLAGFVAGELAIARLPGAPAGMCRDGVPDSAFFFCFPEMALLFARLHLHRQFWLQQLPLFVGCADVFAMSFWNGTERHRRAYGYGHGLPLPGDRVRSGIERDWLPLALDEVVERYGNLAARAFRATALTIDPVSTPMELRT